MNTKPPLTIHIRDLEDISTEATALFYTLRAYPGRCHADAGVGERQVATARRLIELCDKIAKYNGMEFKRASADELMEAVK